MAQTKTSSQGKSKLTKHQQTALKNLDVLDKKVADIRAAITEGKPMTLGRQNLLASILVSLRQVQGSW